MLDAVESCGVHCDGRFLALNSYENRVYQVGLEDETRVVAKFYRPDRWSDDAIIEEHAFTAELEALEIPVVAPFVIGGNTLHHIGSYRFCTLSVSGWGVPRNWTMRHILKCWAGSSPGFTMRVQRLTMCIAPRSQSTRISVLQPDTWWNRDLCRIISSTIGKVSLQQ